MARARRSPFDVKLSEEEQEQLTRRLCDAIRVGLQARSRVMDDGGYVDFAYSLYEQQSQAPISGQYGGADLTSPIGTQMVDTLTAIASKTVYDEPFMIVEGFGKDADKAAVVEEHLQWRLEEMRAQGTMTLAIRQSFIEEGAIIEVCEDAMEVSCQEVVKAAVATSPEDGTYLMDAKTKQAMPAEDPDTGELVPAEDGSEFVEVHRTYVDVLRRGATLRLHSMKDFLFLPGHARSKREVWGMASRFWITLGELRAGCESGKYSYDFEDLKEKLGSHQERQQRPEHDRSGISVEVDEGTDAVEKEFWRFQFYADLGKGMCFYMAVVSVEHECLLQYQHDWINRFRFAYLCPYPRTNSVYSYSVILHKLLTTIEGHTAFRNMNAYKAALNANRPKWRLHGAQYDPTIQPWGAGEFIDVNQPNEVGVFPEDEVSQHAFQREREFYEEAARIVGVSDILASVNPKVSRTLGENEMVTEQSFTRAEDPIRNLQEAFEEVGELVHAIEVKTLEEMEQGMQAPASVAQHIGLSLDSPDFDGTVTAEMIKGKFRFKPRGSVDSADPNRRINAFNNMLAMMKVMAEGNPFLAQRYASEPVANALNQEFVGHAKIRDKQAFLAPLAPPPMPMGQPGMPPLMPGATPNGAGMPQTNGGPVVPSFGGDELLQNMLSQVQ